MTDTPPASEEAKTDAPPPKPRNWRGYAKEYIVIVVGVLTALAAQQAADWLRWQSDVKAARVALRGEMTSVADYYRRRDAIASCVDAKLDRVQAMIADLAAGRQPALEGMAFNGLGAATYDSEWQSQRESQTLTHFPREELAAMSVFYGQIVTMRDWSLEEADTWARLAVLQDGSLAAEDLAQLRINYHRARRFQFIITLNARRQLEVAARLGLVSTPPNAAQAAEYCNATSRATKY